MDACLDLLLPRIWPMENLHHQVEQFVWGGVAYPQGPGVYRWGQHIELRRHEVCPPYLLTYLPEGLFQADWVYLTLGGKGLDLLAREVNGDEVDWGGPPFQAFLREQLSRNPNWAVIFSPHCDQIDSTLETDAAGVLTLLNKNLSRDGEQQGFAAWHRAESTYAPPRE